MAEIEMETTHTQSVTGSQTVPPSGENREGNQNGLQDGIIETLRNNKLVIPVTILPTTIFFSLTTFRSPSNMNLGMKTFMHLLPISFIAFLIGIALHKKYPGISDKFKLIGYGISVWVISGLMASFLGLYGAVIPILCSVVATVALLMAWFNKL